MGKYWTDKTDSVDFISAADFNSAFSGIDTDVNSLDTSKANKSETESALALKTNNEDFTSHVAEFSAHKTDVDAHEEAFAAERKRFNPIYCNALFGSADGANITVSDAVEGTPLALTLYGKCTETLSDSSAEKSPDNPATITGIGESGSVTVTMCGKNMFDADTLYDRFCKRAIQQGISTTFFSDNVVFDGRNCVRNTHLGASQGTALFKNGMENTQYTFTFYQYVDSAAQKGPNYIIVYTDGSRASVSYSKQQAWEKIVITTSAGKTVLQISQSYTDTPYVTTYWDKNSMMLSVGATEAAYEPYEAQEIAIPLSAPLYGIKHPTTGEWLVRDEIRVEDGKVFLIRNIGKTQITENARYITVDAGDKTFAFVYVIQDMSKYGNTYGASGVHDKKRLAILSPLLKSGLSNNNNTPTDIALGYPGGYDRQICIRISRATLGVTSEATADEIKAAFKTWVSDYNSTHDIKFDVYYLMKTADTTDVTDTEAGQALLALVSQNGDTITNSDGADMSLTYNRDINKALAEINNAIIALGGTI